MINRLLQGSNVQPGLPVSINVFKMKAIFLEFQLYKEKRVN